MIDDEKEVQQLLRDMEGQLPISAHPARELVESLTRGGVKCRPDENLQIGSVLYLGDVGGIACGAREVAHRRHERGRCVSDASSS